MRGFDADKHPCFSVWLTASDFLWAQLTSRSILHLLTSSPKLGEVNWLESRRFHFITDWKVCVLFTVHVQICFMTLDLCVYSILDPLAVTVVATYPSLAPQQNLVVTSLSGQLSNTSSPSTLPVVLVTSMCHSLGYGILPHKMCHILTSTGGGIKDDKKCGAFKWRETK